MRFSPLGTTKEEKSVLVNDFNAGHEVGVLHIGKQYLFFQKKLTTFYIPYSEVTHIFRRVMLIPAKMCCGKGDFEMENLVLYNEAKGEIAQISLPGKKAAHIVMDELKEIAPAIIYAKPEADKGEKND